MYNCAEKKRSSEIGKTLPNLSNNNSNNYLWLRIFFATRIFMGIPKYLGLARILMNLSQKRIVHLTLIRIPKEKKSISLQDSL